MNPFENAKRCVLGAALLGLGLAGPAAAEITAPLATGETLLYAFVGAENDDAGINRIATAVYCTNVSTRTIRVRIEFFGSAGGIVDTATIDLDHGVTLGFATDAIVSAPNVGDLDSDDFSEGSGRVVALGRRPQVHCIAQLWEYQHTDRPGVSNLPMIEVKKLRIRVER